MIKFRRRLPSLTFTAKIPMLLSVAFALLLPHRLRGDSFTYDNVPATAYYQNGTDGLGLWTGPEIHPPTGTVLGPSSSVVVRINLTDALTVASPGHGAYVGLYFDLPTPPGELVSVLYQLFLDGVSLGPSFGNEYIADRPGIPGVSLATIFPPELTGLSFNSYEVTIYNKTQEVGLNYILPLLYVEGNTIREDPVPIPKVPDEGATLCLLIGAITSLAALRRRLGQ